MNKFFKIFFIAVLGFLFSRCHKNEDVAIIPLADYTVQYNTDLGIIETYLKTHSYTVDANYNVTYARVPLLDPTSIWGTDNTTPKANVLTRHYTSLIAYGSVDYKIYYLQLNQGTGDSPCNVDSVVAAYSGTLIDPTNDETNNAVVFDYSNNAQNIFNLTNVIRGWSEILPQFKAADNITYNADGSSSYSNYGAGVMFLPSGLAYYQNGAGLIPAYTPIKFSFKLIKVYRNDQDNDGIPSYLEDIGGPAGAHIPDGYIYNLDTGVYNVDDTDADGIPDYLDTDDDGDGYLTRTEIKKPNGSTPLDGPSLYYPYDPTATELRGVPSYSATGTPDYTSPGRLRIHLDPNHHTATP